MQTSDFAGSERKDIYALKTKDLKQKISAGYSLI